MKILCYVNTLSGGGAERVMSVLANALSRLGNTVSLVTDYTTPNEYQLDATINRVIIDGEFAGASRKGILMRTIHRVLTLRNLCRDRQVDIVISFMSEANFRAILATVFSKTKSLISVRVDPRIGYKRKITAMLAKLLYPLTDGCVFQTEEAQEWFLLAIQKKSRIIFNPVSDDFYHVQGTPLRDKRIVSCGRLSDQKRFDLLINSFDRICDEFPEYTLEIYGTGSLKVELEAQIAELGREDRIRLMGCCEDIPNTIKDASLFVLSSDYEGLPNALMEAMVLGLPVIATDCGGGGARALINDGADGLIVPCGDVEALAAAIRLSLKDLNAAKARGDQAKQKGARFKAESVVSDWERYIYEICGKSPEGATLEI